MVVVARVTCCRVFLLVFVGCCLLYVGDCYMVFVCLLVCVIVVVCFVCCTDLLLYVVRRSLCVVCCSLINACCSVFVVRCVLSFMFFVGWFLFVVSVSLMLPVVVGWVWSLLNVVCGF